MKIAKAHIFVFILTISLLFGNFTHAQYFGGNNSNNAKISEHNSSNTKSSNNQVEDSSLVANQKRNVTVSGNQNNPSNTPSKQEPSLNVAEFPNIIIASDDKNMDDRIIMLFMKDFDVYRSPSGETRCDVKFAVVTTLPTRMTNLSYRLKWPNLQTTVSFNSVEPFIENYFNYTLLGNGCYDMDTQPNIVVNRCRVKGLSQNECARKIRWMKPTKQ